jgi:hypothetical protein
MVATESASDTAAPQVRFRKVTGAPSYYRVRYEVVVAGKVVGYVESSEVAHNHQQRGSRIVERRTYSDRWKPSGVRVAGMSYDTRRGAAEYVLRDALGLGTREARELAKTARNETKAERSGQIERY